MSFWPRLSARAVVEAPEVVPIIRTFFSGFNRHRLAVLTVDPGEDPTTIWTPAIDGTSVESPYLSPNGLRIAWVMPNTGGDPGSEDGVWTANPDGSDPTHIFGPTDTGWIFPPNFVAWSPDSSTLVFGVPSETSIWTIPAAGGAITELYNAGGTDIGNPAYNFDGSKIAFTKLLSASTMGLWVMDADGSNDAQIAVLPTQFSGVSFEAPPFAWQRTASKIAFNSNTLASPTWTLADDDGTNTVTLLSGIGSGGGHPCWQAWLPADAGLLIKGQYVSGGATDEVYALDPAGGGASLFHDFGTAIPGSNLFVYFGRLYVDMSSDIYSVKLDGTDQRNEGSGTTDNLGLTG